MKLITTLDTKNCKIRKSLMKDIEAKKLANILGFAGDITSKGETFLFLPNTKSVMPIGVLNPTKKERRRIPHISAIDWLKQEEKAQSRVWA